MDAASERRNRLDHARMATTNTSSEPRAPGAAAATAAPARHRGCVDRRDGADAGDVGHRGRTGRAARARRAARVRLRDGRHRAGRLWVRPPVGRVRHAGSVYGFVGHAFGPRAGFFCGWALLGTYLVFPAVSMAGVAVFGQAFLKSTGIAPNFPWYPLALIGWAVIAIRRLERGAESDQRARRLRADLGDADPRADGRDRDRADQRRRPPKSGVHRSTCSKLPAGTGLARSAWPPPSGSSPSRDSSRLGPSARRPTSRGARCPSRCGLRSASARAFYVLCMVVQTLGFGTDAAGVSAFASPRPRSVTGEDVRRPGHGRRA